ncbi:HAD family hydrolase [Streptacidiphilus sp. N1-10]|uniref:HAD family hydrolase n=1 Tax=Streptacidiphilus jeojiensis TaxID=3229225 RepID=A0ABV6XVM3_9ACTN
MTLEHPPPLSGSEEVVRCILFDFDGPLVRLFTGHSAARVAKEVRTDLRRRWDIRYRPVRGRSNCHGAIAAFPDLTRNRQDKDAIEASPLALIATAERRAVRDAAPTFGAEELVLQLHKDGWEMAITSNNADEAIHDYLDQDRSARIRPVFDGMVFGRGRIAAIKPEPDCVNEALKALGIDARNHRVVLLGDSVSDYQAAVAAEIDFVGYSRRRPKRRQLRRAGAE